MRPFLCDHLKEIHGIGMTPVRNRNLHHLHQIGLNLIQDLHHALGEEVLVKIGGNLLGMHSHSHLFLVVC